MKYKKCKSQKHWPSKNRQFKGCFGSGPFESKEKKHLVKLGKALGLRDEALAEPALKKLDDVLRHPTYILDTRCVEKMSLRFGIILKAFFDEFTSKYGYSPNIYPPRSKKVKAIFNHLKISNYPGVNTKDYDDITCWQIVDWEITANEEGNRVTRNSLGRDISPPDLLIKEIIPKCWSGTHKMAEDSDAIATSVSEMLFNCAEHAYTGHKENSFFRKWYLGVGEYPESKQFAFCIYDKGVGIKDRLQQNPRNLSHVFFDSIKTDSGMIKLATEGRSGADINDGRGQGLKNSIELLSVNNGQLTIYSDRGVFESDDPRRSKDRKTNVTGTMIAFSFPINYSKDTK